MRRCPGDFAELAIRWVQTERLHWTFQLREETKKLLKATFCWTCIMSNIYATFSWLNKLLSYHIGYHLLLFAFEYLISLLFTNLLFITNKRCYSREKIHNANLVVLVMSLSANLTLLWYLLTASKTNIF